jgi:hypothetical protein
VAVPAGRSDESEASSGVGINAIAAEVEVLESKDESAYARPRLNLSFAVAGTVAVAVAVAIIGFAINSTTTSDVNEGNCNGTGNNSVSCSTLRPTGPSTTVDSAPSSTSSTVPPVQPVAKYTVTLPDGYYVPIGPKAPTHGQMSTKVGGDIIYTASSGTTVISPVSPNSTIAPSRGMPTLGGCVAATDTQASVIANQGSTFCLYEVANGLVIGGIVTYLDQSAINSDSVTVQFTVWSAGS